MTGIATLEYPNAEFFFDSASIGDESREAMRAARDESIGWEEALGDVRDGCSRLLDTDPTYVTVFHNTTAGVQRILLRLARILRGHRATLMTTDLEYPGILASLDETWHGRVVIARVSELIYHGEASRVSEHLRRLFLLAQPDVVYISHIARAFGHRLDEGFLRFVKTVNPQTVRVVDGAQAVGNIAVQGRFLRELVDFYVWSGHKWLGGRETLGVVWSSPEWKLADPAQSYSRSIGSGGTGVIAALRSLAASLRDFNDPVDVTKPGQRIIEIEENNAGLAGAFVRKLHELAIPLGYLNPDQRMTSGIVAIPALGAAVTRDLRRKRRGRSAKGRRREIVFTHIRKERLVPEEGGEPPASRFILGLAGPEMKLVKEQRILREAGTVTPLPKLGLYRFCFHYYHDMDHVRQLADWIATSYRRCQPRKKGGSVA